jgi:hypothetical protein
LVIGTNATLETGKFEIFIHSSSYYRRRNNSWMALLREMLASVVPFTLLVLRDLGMQATPLHWEQMYIRVLVIWMAYSAYDGTASCTEGHVAFIGVEKGDPQHGEKMQDPSMRAESQVGELVLEWRVLQR